jgi:hypothetical protein
MRGVYAMSVCEECVRGVYARSVCEECMRGVCERSVCEECMRGCMRVDEGGSNDCIQRLPHLQHLLLHLVVFPAKTRECMSGCVRERA